ncbi:phosphatase PAP2 family protein [Olivibacter domesticus]|uniref:PAP2 superfamily protein n=1 Tax=Olivibacter domesticus TaxID=407022 RepID=A0A1H7MWR7_OLID1|nr:phosphatase PAP2 family protein [Olivibacter domesticus]SEL15654.1 PAP2 superfamily protein [Olivibacter domesticus]
MFLKQWNLIKLILCVSVFGVSETSAQWRQYAVEEHRIEMLPVGKSFYEQQPLNFRGGQLYAPISLMLSGFLANSNGPESLKMEIVEERNEHFANFHTGIDNYLQYAPIAAVYTMDAYGYKAKHDFVNRSAILFKGELMMSAIVFTAKSSFHNLRPDGSTYNSFPSGHTAQAFAAATFLAEEYGSTYKWMPYVAYSAATCVGGMRMANNRHYISDVLFGAGIGILTMKVAYWTHRFKWGKKRSSHSADYN